MGKETLPRENTSVKEVQKETTKPQEIEKQTNKKILQQEEYKSQNQSEKEAQVKVKRTQIIAIGLVTFFIIGFGINSLVEHNTKVEHEKEEKAFFARIKADAERARQKNIAYEKAEEARKAKLKLALLKQQEEEKARAEKLKLAKEKKSEEIQDPSTTWWKDHDVFSDPTKGLMWQDEEYTLKELSVFEKPIKEYKKVLTWNSAKQYCKDLKLSGFYEWRLPSREELRDLNKIKKKLKYAPNKFYFSSELRKPFGVYGVIFGHGDSWIGTKAPNFGLVRCVREETQKTVSDNWWE
jgi:hypothetical protein